jgi:internalin A
MWAMLFPIATGAEPSGVKTFLEWCNEKSSLSVETRKSVDLLLEAAGTQNCPAADQKEGLSP